MLRQDIRRAEETGHRANMTLTDDEATKFWPIYDQYTAEAVEDR